MYSWFSVIKLFPENILFASQEREWQEAAGGLWHKIKQTEKNSL